MTASIRFLSEVDEPCRPNPEHDGLRIKPTTDGVKEVRRDLHRPHPTPLSTVCGFLDSDRPRPHAHPYSLTSPLGRDGTSGIRTSLVGLYNLTQTPGQKRLLHNRTPLGLPSTPSG